MAISEPTKFKGVTHIGKDLVTQNLLYGVIDFYQWSYLQIGGFHNVTTSPDLSGVYGGHRNRLRPATDPYYTDGQVWEGLRSDWVWETGIPTEYINQEPIRVSGVHIGGTTFKTVTPFKNRDIESSDGFVDYPRGRVILNTAINTNSVVTCEHSYRQVSFVTSESPWIQELQDDSFRADYPDATIAGSGAWSTMPEARRSMPFVAVEATPRKTFRPLQIGGGQYIDQDVYFHVFTENAWERDQILDTISYQNNKTIYLADQTRIRAAKNYPINIDYTGSPVPSSMMYPDMVGASGTNTSPILSRYGGGFRWKSAYSKNSSVQDVQQIDSNLYTGIIRVTYEIEAADL